MATFYNQATLSFGGNVVNSNTTEAELLSGLELTKTAISAAYSPSGSVVYAITLSNMGATPYNALTITDDLGAYTIGGGGTAVPLSYVNGSILYYLNGALQPAPTVSAVGNLQISGINLPANSIATFIYEARANEFAPVAAGSEITNTAITDGGVGIGILTATATVPVEEAPELTIAKAVCPAIINDNDQLTYTIIVQNLGNLPIVATDGVTISDTFNPILTNITVTLNGTPLTAGTDYTYDGATGAFATTDGVITVPAATYVQDPVTGSISTTPGVAVITVTGTV